MLIPRTCILCKEMYFDLGEPDWSDVTLGVDWYSCCSKDHWRVSGCDVTWEDYRKNLLTAEKCPDFVISPDLSQYLKGE